LLYVIGEHSSRALGFPESLQGQVPIQGFAGADRRPDLNSPRIPDPSAGLPGVGEGLSRVFDPALTTRLVHRRMGRAIHRPRALPLSQFP
jgi:hypothetical protein